MKKTIIALLPFFSALVTVTSDGNISLGTGDKEPIVTVLNNLTSSVLSMFADFLPQIILVIGAGVIIAFVFKFIRR